MGVPTSPALALLVVLAAAAPSTPSRPAGQRPAAKPATAAPTATSAPSTVSTAPAMPDTLVPVYWRTRAERSGGRATADYEETIRYCRQLEAGSRWIQYQSFGKSGQGRDLPLLVVSSDRAFTPEAARATGKAVLLVQNGIHAGEIEGKDASLALVRDIAVLRKRTELLDHAILLVVPMLSPDGHERRGRFQRMNQNGPDEMGWRANATGLNLNRDYVKLETPEMRALIGNVFTKWWPHLLVDDHTTDGADFQYDVTYLIQHGAGVPPDLDRWMREAFEGRVVPRLGALGHVVAPYLQFRSGNDPAGGLFYGNTTPRFSQAYAVLRNRPGIIVETHSLKPYGQRVRATYDLLVALLEEVNARPAALIDAVRSAETMTAARAATTGAAREVVLASDTTSTAAPFVFRGWRTRWEKSEITGSLVPRYERDTVTTIVPLQRETRPTLVVRQPAGYLVPQEWPRCRERLELHGIRYRRFRQTWSDSVEAARILEWNSGNLAEGHRETRVTRIALERRRATMRPGDLWVPLDQPGATLAMTLCEPQSPDGFLRWNEFDTIFERKEYGEAYLIDPVARRMLARDPALAREFQAKLAADPAFAADPSARADFFFRKSEWADPEQNVHPILRALAAPPETVLEPARP